MSFLLFLSFSLTLLSERSYKSTPTRTLFGSERSGAPPGGSTTPLLFFTLSTLLLLYKETPFYLSKRVVRSFVLPYVTLL